MFKYFRELFLEIKIWRKIRKIAKASTEALEKDNFRVDWIGRIYTVINLPEEMMERTRSKNGRQGGWCWCEIGNLAPPPRNRRSTTLSNTWIMFRQTYPHHAEQQNSAF